MSRRRNGRWDGRIKSWHKRRYNKRNVPTLSRRAWCRRLEKPVPAARNDKAKPLREADNEQVPEQGAELTTADSGCLCEAWTATWTAWLMRATRSGERAAVEAEGGGFATGTAPTSGEETTTSSPDCKNTMEDAVPLVAEADTGAEDTIMGGELLLNCYWFACLLWGRRTKEMDEAIKLPGSRRNRSDRKSSTNVWFSAWNKLHNITQLEHTIHVIYEKPRMSHQSAWFPVHCWPALTRF